MARKGWTLLRGKRHLIFRGPGGARIVMSATPSDWRAERKRERDIRKARRAGGGEDASA